MRQPDRSKYKTANYFQNGEVLTPLPPTHSSFSPPSGEQKKNLGEWQNYPAPNQDRESEKQTLLDHIRTCVHIAIPVQQPATGQGGRVTGPPVPQNGFRRLPSLVRQWNEPFHTNGKKAESKAPLVQVLSPPSFSSAKQD